MRFSLSRLILLISLSLTGPLQAELRALGEVSPGLAKTCHHYENRTKYRSRTEPGAFNLLLAVSCRQALQELQQNATGNSPASDHARHYLERLRLYKDTIIQLNLSSFAAARSASSRPFQRRSMGSVTPTGAYLIAREMGLISAYRNWASHSGFELSQDVAAPQIGEDP